MRTVNLVVAALLTFGFVVPSVAWDGLGHQILGPASAQLAANDGGPDFASAFAILKEHSGLMNEAVIAPDVNAKLINPPIFPPLFHGHEAFRHVGFDDMESHDSEYLISFYLKRAVEKWEAGDIPGALYDLGCALHILHDASYCGHSNFLHIASWEAHSSFENWVRDMTAPDKKPKSFEELHHEAWVVESGGIYLKESWRDEAGKEHWAGGLESWIDVAAHYSYRLLDSSSLKHDSCDFQGAAHQQFAASQRCGAGLLLDFFRCVGVVPQPVLYFKRDGAVWRFRLGDDSSQRLGLQGELCPADFWPTTSPSGKSRLFYLDSRTKQQGQSDFGVTVGDRNWGWDFTRTKWPSAPEKISQAFYVDNYAIALVDASEGDNWRHLFLVPAMPGPDVWYDCPKESMQYFFDGPDELWAHHIQKVDLP